jgi:hypothetical protein
LSDLVDPLVCSHFGRSSSAVRFVSAIGEILDPYHFEKKNIIQILHLNLNPFMILPWALILCFMVGPSIFDPKNAWKRLA